jgi:hypothetical protein
VAENLQGCWREVVVSELGPPLNPENKRQRRGNKKQIIEVLMKKGPRANRFDQPAIGGVEKTGRQTQWVEHVTE